MDIDPPDGPLVDPQHPFDRGLVGRARHEIHVPPIGLDLPHVCHATSCSKSRVKSDPGRANGTPSVRTPMLRARQPAERRTDLQPPNAKPSAGANMRSAVHTSIINSHNNQVGGVRVAERAQLVPVGAANLVQRTRSAGARAIGI